MCKAFDDMMRDSKQEGIREGRREGERKTEERRNELIQKLVSAGRINDLLQASNNKKYRKKLMAELGIRKGKIGWQPLIAVTLFD